MKNTHAKILAPGINIECLVSTLYFTKNFNIFTLTVIVLYKRSPCLSNRRDKKDNDKCSIECFGKFIYLFTRKYGNILYEYLWIETAVVEYLYTKTVRFEISMIVVGLKELLIKSINLLYFVFSLQPGSCIMFFSYLFIHINRTERFVSVLVYKLTFYL